jgi:Leucine-rich repeat (LRR) protein
MSETINFEQAVLENLRQLPREKQQELLDFAQFLVQKAEQKKQLPSESSESNTSSTTAPTLKLSLREIANLPIAERHKILAPYMAATAEDFLTYPELTEFSVLDGEDWETEYDY